MLWYPEFQSFVWKLKQWREVVGKQMELAARKVVEQGAEQIVVRTFVEESGFPVERKG